MSRDASQLTTAPAAELIQHAATLVQQVADVAARVDTVAANHRQTITGLSQVAAQQAVTQQALAQVAPATAAAVAASVKQEVLAGLSQSPQVSRNLWISVWALGAVVVAAVGYLLVEAVSLHDPTAHAWLPYVVVGLLGITGIGGAYTAKSPLQ